MKIKITIIEIDWRGEEPHSAFVYPNGQPPSRKGHQTADAISDLLRREVRCALEPLLLEDNRNGTFFTQ